MILNSYNWDTTGAPNGVNYIVKVITSDGKINTSDISDELFAVNNDVTSTSAPPPLPTTTPGFSAYLVILGIVGALLLSRKRNRRLL